MEQPWFPFGFVYPFIPALSLDHMQREISGFLAAKCTIWFTIYCVCLVIAAEPAVYSCFLELFGWKQLSGAGITLKETVKKQDVKSKQPQCV